MFDDQVNYDGWFMSHTWLEPKEKKKQGKREKKGNERRKRASVPKVYSHSSTHTPRHIHNPATAIDLFLFGELTQNDTRCWPGHSLTYKRHYTTKKGPEWSVYSDMKTQIDYCRIRLAVKSWMGVWNEMTNRSTTKESLSRVLAFLIWTMYYYWTLVWS